MKIIKKLLGTIILSYALILISAYFFQESLLFFPKQWSERPEIKKNKYLTEVSIETRDQQKIHGLLYEDKNFPTITVYFHGNAGSLNYWQNIYETFQNFGTNLLVIDYRGYGKSTGKFSEEGFYLDAQAAYDYAQAIGYSENQIVIYGRSLGTGIAVELASKNNARALVLETPYTSVLNRSKELYPYLLPDLLLRYPFNSERKIESVKMPIYIFHGTEDEIIPFNHGKSLYEKIPGNKTFVQIVGGRHNDLENYKEYQDTLKSFYNSLNSTITLL